MTKQRDGLKRVLSPSDPTKKEWESEEAAVAYRLKQEEEQHYREVLVTYIEAESCYAVVLPPGSSDVCGHIDPDDLGGGSMEGGECPQFLALLANEIDMIIDD